MGKDFEIVSHTSDLKIRAHSKSLEGLFRTMLCGMFKSLDPIYKSPISKSPKNLKKITQRSFDITSHDLELLLVDFLSEAIYLSDLHKEAYFDLEIETISDTHIKGILSGSSITGFELGEIKAVTHHELKVESLDGKWQAEVIFDL